MKNLKIIINAINKYFNLSKKADYQHAIDRIRQVENERAPQYCKRELINQADRIVEKIDHLNKYYKNEIHKLYLDKKSLFQRPDITKPPIALWKERAFQGYPDPGEKPERRGDSDSIEYFESLKKYQKNLDNYKKQFGPDHYIFLISIKKNNNPNKNLLELSTFRPDWKDHVNDLAAVDLGECKSFDDFYNDCQKLPREKDPAPVPETPKPPAPTPEPAKVVDFPQADFFYKDKKNKFYVAKHVWDTGRADRFWIEEIFKTKAETEDYIIKYFERNENNIENKREKNKKYRVEFRVTSKTAKDIVFTMSFDDFKQYKKEKEKAATKSVEYTVTKIDKSLGEEKNTFSSYEECVNYILEFFHTNESLLLENENNVSFQIDKKDINDETFKIFEINFEDWYLMNSSERDSLRIEKQAAALVKKYRIMKRASFFLKIIKNHEKY